MRRPPAPEDYDGWVAQLRVTSCRQRAKHHLLASGAAVLPALRRGLRHPDPLVRRQCVRIFDQLVDEASLAELVMALDDTDAIVRASALHALACDRCKQGACRPGEDLWVPKALALLRDDPDPDLRAAAIDALGKVAARLPHVAEALAEAAEHDRDQRLRSMARRYAHLAPTR
jgi:HEAT repeat protein